MMYHWGWLLAAILLAIFIEIALICGRSLARKVPINYILLLIFTVCETYMVACSTVYYSAYPYTVIQAGVGTAMITLACTAYAFKAKADFTMKGGLIFLLFAVALFFILFAFIIVAASSPGESHPVFVNIICCIVILLLGLFLIHDTQLIVGKGKWKLSIDDYIIGAMIIYIDIITIFLYMLALFKKK
jgi:protein lifeguard